MPLAFIYLLPLLLASSSVFTTNNHPYCYCTIYLLLTYNLPVLAAAPDSKSPFSRISPSTTPILLKNPTQLREILQTTPFLYPQLSENPTFPPLAPRKPHFSLKKPPKTPLFSDFSYFFIKNSGFQGHFTPAALIPYFSLFFPIFRKSSNSRLFPTFPRFIDQKPMKTPFFNKTHHFSTKTSIFNQKPQQPPFFLIPPPSGISHFSGKAYSLYLSRY